MKKNLKDALTVLTLGARRFELDLHFQEDPEGQVLITLSKSCPNGEAYAFAGTPTEAIANVEGILSGMEWERSRVRYLIEEQRIFNDAAIIEFDVDA